MILIRPICPTGRLFGAMFNMFFTKHILNLHHVQKDISFTKMYFEGLHSNTF